MQPEDATALAMVKAGYALGDPTDQRRVLKFRVAFNEVENACEALRAIGRYNEFDGEKVADALMRANTGQARVEVGREGSPVLYVGGFRNDSEAGTVRVTMEQALADEISTDQRGTVRAWWD